MFAGADSDYADAGDLLFAIVTTAEFDPWRTVTGDVTGDGSVTQADIDIILANMGLEGENLTIADGDLNGDGVVDALDLAIAMDHFGTQLIDVTWGAGGDPMLLGGGGEEVQAWKRIPGWTVPVCNVQGGVEGALRVAAWALNSRVGAARCEYTAERMWRHVWAFRHPPRLAAV